MSFFIADAHAAAPAAPTPGAPGGLVSWGMIALMLAVFYLMIIRPQNKKAKEHKSLIDNLSKGDEVVLNGGMLGKVMKVTEEFVIVEVANNVEISFQKNAIIATLPKGTLKGI